MRGSSESSLARAMCSQSEESVARRVQVVCLLKGQSLPDKYQQAFDRSRRFHYVLDYVPPIEFQYTNSQLLHAALSTPGRWAGVVVTSARAVTALGQALESNSQLLEVAHSSGAS